MFNAEKLLGNLLTGAMGSGRGHKHGHGGGLLGGAAGMAAIGLAIEAFEHFSGQKQPQQASTMPPAPGMSGQAPPPPASPGAAGPPPSMPAPGALQSSAPPPAPPAMPGTQPAPALSESDAILLIRAMIAASYADGTLDAQEMKNIIDRMESAGLDSEERQFILKELSNPAGIDSIIGAVNSPELARQVYAVSLMAIEIDTEKEREYMTTLARRLFLSNDAIAAIHDSLGKSRIS